MWRFAPRHPQGKRGLRCAAGRSSRFLVSKDEKAISGRGEIGRARQVPAASGLLADSCQRVFFNSLRRVGRSCSPRGTPGRAESRRRREQHRPRRVRHRHENHRSRGGGQSHQKHTLGLTLLGARSAITRRHCSAAGEAGSGTDPVLNVCIEATASVLRARESAYGCRR